MTPSLLSSLFRSCLFRSSSFLWAVVAAPAVLGAQQGKAGTVVVTVALVAEELQVRRVPLFSLELVSVADSTAKIALRTGLDGSATQPAAAGAYRLRSVAPARLAGRAFSWSVAATVAAGKTMTIELTNANASVDSSGAAPTVGGGRQLAPEVAVYDRVKHGVLRVSAGLKSGSGFLLDTLGGVLITNAHVIEGEREVSVAIDSVTRVPAQIVVRDHDADLAILRFDPTACPACIRLRPALAESGSAIVIPGERVIAVGFPLHQPSTVTSGIVSSLRDRAIISDVNLNPGNSGGPMLNMAGQVVGVNTFGDQAQRGPGVAGAILLTQLASLLARAGDTLSKLTPPDANRLAVLSGPAYPLAVVRSVAESAHYDAYRDFDDIDAGKFKMTVLTPVAQFVLLKEFERQITHDRRKREARAGLSEDERYSEFAPYRDWLEYVGEATAPAVSVSIVPKQGETTGSLFRRMLVTGARGRQTYTFKGDLQDAVIKRNGRPVAAIIGGRDPIAVFADNAWVKMKDVAYRGYYVFAPELLAPDSTGAPPSIVLEITDLKHPEDRTSVELTAETVARAWNDFAPYYRAQYPDRPFLLADARKFRSMVKP